MTHVIRLLKLSDLGFVARSDDDMKPQRARVHRSESRRRNGETDTDVIQYGRQLDATDVEEINDRRRSVARSFAERIMIAVLEQAACDLLDVRRRSVTAYGRRMAMDAASWFLRDERGPMSFLTICEHFDFDAEAIRERLGVYDHEREARPMRWQANRKTDARTRVTSLEAIPARKPRKGRRTRCRKDGLQQRMKGEGAA